MTAANIGLATARSNKNPVQDQFLVSVHMAEAKFAESSTQSALFPLYLYPEEDIEQRDAFTPKDRTLNLDPKLYAAICKAAGIDPADTAIARDQKPLSLEERHGVGTRNPGAVPAESPPSQPSPLKEGGLYDFRAATGEARPSEVKVFDYIYGVLHSPAYRETFAEFLKIDFPRIPYPPSPEVFRHVSEKGEELRRLHLMEPAAIGETPYRYEGPEDGGGDDVVAKGYPKWESSPGRGGGGRAAAGGGGLPSSAAPEASPLHHPADGPAVPAERLRLPRAGEDLGRVLINKDQYFADVPLTYQLADGVILHRPRVAKRAAP